MVRSRAVLVAIAVAAGSAGGWWAARTPSGGRLDARVVEVVDGDTVVVEVAGRTETVRVLQIDTPETKHPERGVECFGPEAAAFTTAAVDGRRVTLVLDAQPRDVYGRLLAHVEVGGWSLGTALIERGLARLLVIPPNTSGGRSLLAAELEARAAGRGLWGACA